MPAPQNIYEAKMLEAFEPALTVSAPAHWRSGVIFASPHSGRIYPESFVSRCDLPRLALRRNEDAFIDALFAPAPALGAPLLAANFPRCIVDVNRAPDEMPRHWIGMAAKEPKKRRRAKTIAARADAGLGVIPTSLGESVPIYSEPISPEVAPARLQALYYPYHEALMELITAASLRFGSALLIDCHSMPGFAPMGTRRPDVILGDCFGQSCRLVTLQLLEGAFEKRGYNVARNYPYAGGFVTEHYGKPDSGIETLQIEINRDLYLNPITLKPKRGYDNLAKDIEQIIGEVINARDAQALIAAQ